MKGLIDRKARRLYADNKISALHERAPFDRRIAVVGQESREIGDRLNAMYTRGPAIFNFMKNTKLLDIAESLIGPEILCHPTQQFRPRIPDQSMGSYVYSGSYSGWHQDAGVLAPEADNHLLVTIWIPLTEATVENGCLLVIPGSHKRGIRRHQPSPTPPVLFIPRRGTAGRRADSIADRAGRRTLAAQLHLPRQLAKQLRSRSLEHRFALPGLVQTDWSLLLPWLHSAE